MACARMAPAPGALGALAAAATALVLLACPADGLSVGAGGYVHIGDAARGVNAGGVGGGGALGGGGAGAAPPLPAPPPHSFAASASASTSASGATAATAPAAGAMVQYLPFPLKPLDLGPAEEDEGTPTKKMIVACVGDSITWGLGTDDPTREGYPTQLQEMLGPGFEVKNFGFPGSCALKDSDLPYAVNARFIEGLESKADVFILMLGTNDAKEHNWVKKDHFLADYMDLVDQLFAVGAKIVLIMAPPPMYAPVKGSTGPSSTSQLWQNTINRDLQPLVDVVAILRALPPAIDVHGAFEAECDDFKTDCPLMSHDGTHPSALGYDRIATRVYHALREQTYLAPAFSASAAA